MSANHYPDIAKHMKEHLILVRTLTDFKKKFEKGTVTFTPSIITFLEEWLTRHMIHMDKPMGKFVSSMAAARVAA